MKACREIEAKSNLAPSVINKKTVNINLVFIVDYKKYDLKSQITFLICYLPHYYLSLQIIN